MNPQYMILCVDDEREVLDSVVQDLESFEEHFIIEATQSVTEAKSVLKDYADNGVKLALILCDHLMPDQTGIQFLIELNQHEATRHSRKVLLTGQAGLEDTIDAVNHASLDFYIGKPWTASALRETVKQQLTLYMIEHENNLAPWLSILDANALLQKMSEQRSQFGE